MTAKKRVLVLGASGMIGRAIEAQAWLEDSLELVPASHRTIDGYAHVDYESLTTRAAWVDVLRSHGIDAVVNCVGIWQGRPETFELVQYIVPVALFDACTELGLRIVHVSALGFPEDSPLPYASTKVRADRYLLANCPPGVVVYPSLVFGHDGGSSKFFMDLAALPVHADFGLGQNLQPVHVDEVASKVLAALVAETPERVIEAAGPYPISNAEYFSGLRKGMGLGPAWVTAKVPEWCGKLIFGAGALVRHPYINHQTWTLLQAGTRGTKHYPDARPYDRLTGAQDLQRVQSLQLYWFVRLGLAFLWLWTAVSTYFLWPWADTLRWLDALLPGLGTPGWLIASSLLDATMGVASLVWPRRKLWLAQFWLTAAYSVGLLWALPEFGAHPFGPLTKNLLVLAAMLYAAQYEKLRGR